MSKKNVIPYGGEEYFAKALGLKVEPVSRKTRISKWFRAHVPVGWTLATKDVRQEAMCKDGAVYATLYAKPGPDCTHGKLVRSLGEYVEELGLVLVECVRLPAGCVSEGPQELAAIVGVEA